jgi:hypothetical protein
MKAIVHKDTSTRASWALHGVNAWMLGPSKDHYQCHLYYIPETSGYHVSSSADRLPQHCTEPTFTPITHVKELSEELQQMLATMRHKNCNLATLETLTCHVNAYIASILLPQPSQPLQQRVQQRVINVAPQSISPIPQKLMEPPATELAKTLPQQENCKLQNRLTSTKREPIHRVCYHVSQRSASLNPQSSLPNIPQ